ncbi:beta-lactamase family protein [Clostridium sp. Sa3CUN1]|uniref:Beta-lactamase family protein n=1 Tax=Clostridium gallinarum TaxID=2762246 RepID=A0ABR8Q307_9CLOT|nr:serine hydrolase domain-containing protein [Clostridium gallinarum]MBD7914810.1 beta-lactamase family protein [Clostridium gallinarum]
MKKRYLLLGVLCVYTCMLTLTSCTNNTIGISNNIIVNEELSQRYKIDEAVEKVVEVGYEGLEKFLDEEALDKKLQGTVLVAEGDKIVFAKAYGYADYENNIENTLTTRFAIASNTKQFTAAVIMQLVEQNKIDINETIDKYFPDYKYANKITVKNLLQMRSGIPDYLNEVETFMLDEDTKSLLKEYEDNVYYDKYVEDDRWSKELILKNMYLTDLLFEPNEEYDYCNTNYYLLGLIIEEASGMSFEDYLNEYIFKPAEMNSSSLVPLNFDAKGYGSSESGIVVANPEFTYAAGAIYSNIYDIFRWCRSLHTGEIISKESYNEMTTPVDDYGYGLFIKENLISHSGFIDGFTSNTEYDIEKDRTIIVLENIGPENDVLDAKYHTSLIREYLN